jgi:hypothetical protein
MNYNRYLDLHLCTSSKMAKIKSKGKSSDCFFNFKGVEYFYDFPQDIMKQLHYREGKNEGFTWANDKGNCKILDKVELTKESGSGWLGFTTGAITEELKQLRYISCMVSIENLKDNAKEWPNLAALVHWISDTSTVNKLRINCHGEGTKAGGFNMGTVTLSAAEFVDALVRHGLTRPGADAAPAPGLLQGARWKADSEKAACEKCNKPFSIMRRKHHCRRCGGLFCDACSAKKVDLAVALTEESRTGVGQHYATAKNVKKARVCDKCYEATMTGAGTVADAIARRGREIAALADLANPSLANKGLKTITLALCMGAMTEDGFSPELDPNLAVGPQAAGTFVRDSLAYRVLEELRRRNLRGIRITASNQIVASTEQGIENRFGVKVPSDDNQWGFRVPSERKVGLSATRNEFSVPAYIWGSSTMLQRTYTRRHAGQPQISGDIKVSPCGRRLYFSEYAARADLSAVKSFLDRWGFSGWLQTEIGVLPQPGAANAIRYTWQLTPPNRVEQMQFVSSNNNKNKIKVIGRAVDMTKQYKSFEVA